MKTTKDATGEIMVVGRKFIADFGENKYLLDFISESELTITVIQGFGKNQTIEYRRTVIRPNIHMVTWQETDRSTVTHIEDFEEGLVYTNTTLPDLTLLPYKGPLSPADVSK